MRKIETVMTYDEWEREYFRHSQKAQKAKEARKWKITQKIMSVILLIITFLICMIFPEDATPIIFTAPLGLYLLVTKRKVIY